MDGSIKFDVSATTAKFDAAMGKVGNSARTAADSVKSAFAGLGALLAGGAVISGLQNILRRMDDVSDAAKRLGATTTDIQKVGNAAQLVGTDLEAVARSMNKMGVQANKAARAGGELAEAFARVDIDPASFAAAGLAERIQMVAAAQQAANGDARKMAELFEVVGIRAANINFTELVAEMQNVNVASESTVEALARANDELDKAKHNAIIFGANLLKGISDASERLGNLVGSGFSSGPETNAEADARQMRDNAVIRLKQRGEYLPDDTSVRDSRHLLGAAAGFNPGAGMEIVPGPNAEENVRRVNAELAKMKAELEAAKIPTAEITDELDQQASTSKQLTDARKQLNEISLQIREAEAAGNQALADDLKEYQSLVEAAIKYEGNLEMAARDVNAAHKERLRLQEEALQKSIQQVEKEVEIAETMAFGTEEAKKKAQWMQVYNDTMSKTERDDLARRAANAETYEAPSALQQNQRQLSFATQSFAPATENERVADLRGRARQSIHDARASELAARGMYRSAIAAQDRGLRAYDRGMESARLKDYLGGASMREAYDAYKKGTKMGERMTYEEYDKSIRDAAKTPQERAREEAARISGGAQGSSGDPMEPVKNLLEQIKKYIVDGDRLPQHALT